MMYKAGHSGTKHKQAKLRRRQREPIAIVSMYPSRIIVFMALTICASGYSEQSVLQKLFDMIRHSARDTATLMTDMKAITYNHEVETENMKTLVDTFKALKNEQNSEAKNMKALINEQMSEIDNIKQRIGGQESMIKNMTALLQQMSEKIDLTLQCVPAQTGKRFTTDNIGNAPVTLLIKPVTN